MKLPQYLIIRTSFYLAKNRAQLMVQDAVKNCEGLTLQNEQDVSEFVKYLEDVVKEAHVRFPACSKMVVESYFSQYSLDSQIAISVDGKVDSHVVIITINRIKGIWIKGGQK